MNRIIPMFQMQFRDRWTWFYLPFIIVGSSFIINLIVSMFLTTSIYTGGLSAIFIYYFVIGILIVPQTFRFALGLSTTRRDFTLGTILAALAALTVCSVILVLAGMTEKATDSWGGNLHFFQLPYLNDGPYFIQFLIYVALFLFMFFGGFLIAGFFRRFGSRSLLLSFVAAAVLMAVFSYFIHQYNLWYDLFNWFANRTAFEVSLWTLPFSFVFAVLSYILLRKSSVQ